MIKIAVGGLVPVMVMMMMKNEILVVDMNYFPGYKEVTNFPSLLAQYLTPKAVESCLRDNFDGS